MTLGSISKFNKAWLGLAIVGGVVLGISSSAFAQEEEERNFSKEAVKRAIATGEVTYDTIASLMRVPGAFGPGAACVVCHNSNDGKKSPGGLDLTSCAGILKGAAAPADGTEPHAIVVAGDYKKGTIRRRLRDNRMPPGVDPAMGSGGPEHQAVKKWIESGAKEDDNFKKNVLPALAKKGAFGAPADQACIDCHMSNLEPPSFHELNLTSFKGIHDGADLLAAPPGVKIVKEKLMDSKLWLRISENRMPVGIDFSEDRDPISTDLVFAWIKQGAKCD